MQAQLIKILLKEGFKRGLILKAIKFVLSPFSPYECNKSDLSQVLFCVRHYLDYISRL